MLILLMVVVVVVVAAAAVVLVVVVMVALILRILFLKNIIFFGLNFYLFLQGEQLLDDGRQGRGTDGIRGSLEQTFSFRDDFSQILELSRQIVQEAKIVSSLQEG